MVTLTGVTTGFPGAVVFARPRTGLTGMLRTALLGALLGALLVGANGCTGNGEEVSSGAAPAGSMPPSSSAPPSPTATPELTLAFAGDVHFMDRTAALLRNPATAFGPITATLAGADLTIVNLETAITSRGTPEPKTYHFRTTPKALDAVKAAGIDAVSLANNHALDYGRVGLADTLDAMKAADFPAFGAGRDATAAYAAWITDVRGVRVAVLGFSQVNELAGPWAAKDDRPGIAMAHDVARATAAVAEARKHADLVIVFNHWGDEGNGCPTGTQKSFAGKLSAAGADLIVGAHAHTLQGAGWLNHTYVAYGLGNFLWYGTSHSTETGVLRLTVRGRSVVKQEFVPAVISGSGQPVPLAGAAAVKLGQRFSGLRGCAGLAEEPN